MDMSTIVDLVHLYEYAGFTVQSSLNPGHFAGYNIAEIPFTYIYQDDKPMCKGGGIAFAEIGFMESVFENYHPQNIFIIGNAFGWSTLALALMNRSARVVAIDWCPRPEEKRGLEVTNALARQAGLNAEALEGKSPDDVARTCQDQFSGPVDFVFIDGGHTPEQLLKDFNTCKDVASLDCVYLFHDVVNFLMMEAFLRVAQTNPELRSSLLFRTPSGMAISYPPRFDDQLAPVVSAFTETDERVKALREEGARRLATQESG